MERFKIPSEREDPHPIELDDSGSADFYPTKPATWQTVIKKEGIYQ